MIIVIMLIYVVSLDLQLPSCITIHNQCLNTKLVSPVYFGNGTVCSKLSGQEINIDAAMKACFEINATQDVFEGALLYRLQKYSDGQYNMDTSTTETNENEKTHVYMLASWRVKGYEHSTHIVLIKYTKEFAWNEDKLRKFYRENCGWLKEYDSTTSYTWLMDDNMVLKTSFKLRGTNEQFELSIFISEEEKDDYTMRPLCVDPER
jgi:hypothetical protein